MQIIPTDPEKLLAANGPKVVHQVCNERFMEVLALLQKYVEQGLAVETDATSVTMRYRGYHDCFNVTTPDHIIRRLVQKLFTDGNTKPVEAPGFMTGVIKT